VIKEIGRVKRGDPMKRAFVLISISVMVLGLTVSHSDGEEEGDKTKWGFAFLGGFNANQKPNLMQTAFLPRFDLALHKNWDLEFEGNFSYYKISDSKDLYLLGIHSNILFKPIQWNKGSLFLIGGVGGAYNNNNGNVKDFGDSHVAGILHGGLGINYNIGKWFGIRGEYRFQHISDPFHKDFGFNTHNFILGLSF
jgi:hypothetical protein